MSLRYPPVSSGGSTNFLQQVALVDAANGDDATGVFGTTKAFKTIQKAVDAVPAYVDPAGQRRWWEIYVAPGTYDEALIVDVTRRKIAIIGVFNLGLFNGSAWGPTNNRDVTVTTNAGNIDGQRHSFMLGSPLSQGEAIGTHTAYMGVPRISGKIILDDSGIVGGTTNDYYLQCRAFDQTATGKSLDGSAKTGIANVYLHRCRFNTAVSGASIRLQKAERSLFDADLSVATYSRIQDSYLAGNVTVTSAPAPDVEPYGFVGCSFGVNKLFTGPIASFVLDGVSNYWFKIRGCGLGGTATKVITEDLIP